MNPDAARKPRRLLAAHPILRSFATGLAVCTHGAHIDNLSREPVHNALGDRPGTLFVDGEKLVQGQWYYWHFTAFPIGKQVDIDGNTIKTFMYRKRSPSKPYDDSFSDRSPTTTVTLASRMPECKIRLTGD